MLNMSWVNVELMLKKVQNEFIIYLKLKKKLPEVQKSSKKITGSSKKFKKNSKKIDGSSKKFKINCRKFKKVQIILSWCDRVVHGYQKPHGYIVVENQSGDKMNKLHTF